MPYQNPNKKIIQIVSILKDRGVIEYIADFCRGIGMSTNSFNMVKNHNRNFTLKQIEKICKVYKINANYIFGLEKNPFF